MRRLAALAIAIGLVFAAVFPVAASPEYPYRKLAKQFSTNTNVFCTADPSPDGTPLTLSSATGDDAGHGMVTVLLTNGFTAPITLTAYYWHRAKQVWVRVAPSTAGYSMLVDSHYTQWEFPLPAGSPFIIMSSAAVTGDVYTNSVADPNNANTAN